MRREESRQVEKANGGSGSDPSTARIAFGRSAHGRRAGHDRSDRSGLCTPGTRASTDDSSRDRNDPGQNLADRSRAHSPLLQSPPSAPPDPPALWCPLPPPCTPRREAPSTPTGRTSSRFSSKSSYTHLPSLVSRHETVFPTCRDTGCRRYRGEHDHHWLLVKERRQPGAGHKGPARHFLRAAGR
jgi:hypothetical protein